MLPLQDTVPHRSPPVVVYILIALNVVVFLFEVSLPKEALQQFIYLFGVVPARYTDPEWARSVGYATGSYWPFLTNMFLHGGFLHIFMNMWFLHIFGDNVEDWMGHVRFIIFYLICGVAASVLHVVANADSTIPSLGASGAIAGVMGAYLLMFRRSRIVAWFPPIFFFELPAALFLIVWFGIQLVSGALSFIPGQQQSGIAWFAHIGGFGTGVVLHRLFLRKPPERRKLHRDEHGLESAWSGHDY